MNKDQANGLEVVGYVSIQKNGLCTGPMTRTIDEFKDFPTCVHNPEIDDIESLVTLSNAQAYAEQVRAETIEECAADKRDAERYRYIKEMAYAEYNENGDFIGLMLPIVNAEQCVSTSDVFEQTIDSAIRALGEKK